MIKINIDKANSITKDIVRQYREPLLKELDVQFQRTLETGSEENKNNIIEKKNELRSMPNYDEVKNIDDLYIMIDNIKSYKVNDE